MKALFIIAVSLALLQHGRAQAPLDGAWQGPVARFTGQFSGFEHAGLREVDLRVRFFELPSGGDMLAERHFGAVLLTAGRFSVPLDPTGISASPLFVEIGLRPAGRRYADFNPAGQRRAVELESAGPDQVWRLRAPAEDAGS
jgi:hypothetical protein